MRQYQSKIAYVLLPYFREKGKENGWYADAYIRMYLSKKGLPLIEGARDDDLFLLLDSDELPNRDVLLFLKLYDGYTEPIRFGFRWTVFGFFWLKTEDPGMLESVRSPLVAAAFSYLCKRKQVPLVGSLITKNKTPKERLLQLWVVCTLGMLHKVYGDNGMLLRRNVWKDDLLKERVKNYTEIEGNVIK